MLLSWLDTKEVDQFADSVVGELLQLFPPSGIDLSTKKSAERAMRKVDRVMLRVSEFASGHRLNLYKKARFSNRVKWALKEAQYPAHFVAAVTHGLATQVAVGSRKPLARRKT